MKKLKIKRPFLSNILALIQDYKNANIECRENIVITINDILEFYAIQCGYKSIKFLPTWWKKDNGKIYLTVKFQFDYKDGDTLYFNFSHFDKIIKSYLNKNKNPS